MDAVVHDSGTRVTGPGGMLKDASSATKPDFTTLDMEVLTRWAAHMTKGAAKYGRDNWRSASTLAELEGFKASAFRHLVQWLSSEDDEDHAVAVMSNIMMYEATVQQVVEFAELEEINERLATADEVVYIVDDTEGERRVREFLRLLDDEEEGDYLVCDC